LNVILSSVGRLFVYGLTCAALPVLRSKNADATAFRLPAGNLWALSGIIITIVLLSRITRDEIIVILATMAIALANWLWARDRHRQKI
jgi:amino acid transporter